ncbi:hypothetical protein ABIE67_009667 [Streptomyces sp. V4I8]|uniref:hypothetical protein n=1 Tax=Streptomyces sp. V4I8 TaxID=3156469 RepID=UPI003514B673
MTLGFYARFEPHTRTDELAQGLAARVYDPAWLLARQWQVGEFDGDNGGSPIRVRHVGRTYRCDTYSDHGGSGELGTTPVEARAEAVPERWARHTRIEIGRALARALRAVGLADRVAEVIAAFPLADGDDLVTGRVPDGGKAYAALSGPLRKDPPEFPSVTPGQGLAEAGERWLKFCDGLIGPPGQAWDARRMEYGFSLHAPGLPLPARAHSGGTPEWWTFDAAAPRAKGDAMPYDKTTIATRVTFHGMPVPRWWQEEDAVVDFGAVEAHPADLARMAMLQFALLYGNDHFAIPVSLPVGSMFETTHLLVTDTFGATTLIAPSTRAGGAERWTMFTLSLATSDGVAEVFLVPPTALQPLSSDPVEDVLLARDEMANLAWAVESVIEGPDGRPVRRAEQHHTPPTTQSPKDGHLAYRLGSTVPPHWFPLTPQRTSTGDVPEYAVEAMAHSAEVPRGDFLQLGALVDDDRLPREGRRLLRDHLLARTTDGGTVVWTRRRTRIGRGETASDLTFDATEHSS